ncbi:MAG: hypothetical protein ABWX92_03110 [Mycetocola sp.]
MAVLQDMRESDRALQLRATPDLPKSDGFKAVELEARLLPGMRAGNDIAERLRTRRILWFIMHSALDPDWPDAAVRSAMGKILWANDQDLTRLGRLWIAWDGQGDAPG